MKVVLVISFLVMGEWIPADELKLNGWYPRTQPNMEVCLERADLINNDEKWKHYRKAHCEERKI